MALYYPGNHFIGRTEEIGLFTNWLADPTAPWILYFHDALEEEEKKGGVGKTWLLNKCEQVARQQQPDLVIVRIDFFDVSSRNGIAIAERIINSLQAAYPQWSAKTVHNVLNMRYERGEIGSEEIDITLPKALRRDLRILDLDLMQARKALLVFFDTFELIEQNPGIASSSFSHTFPDNYQFERMAVVVASRHKIDWNHFNWLGRQAEVLQVPLHPFSKSEMIAYMDHESIYALDPASKQIQELYERTEGRPILIGLVADMLNHRVMDVDALINVQKSQFESYLVAQIHQLENPLNWVILFMAHVYHRFTITILDWILHYPSMKDIVLDVSSQELMEMLPELSFVRGAGAGNALVLHDEMRRLVTLYCWTPQDPDRLYRKEISRCIISNYEKILQNPDSKQGLEYQLYLIEMLYHRLFLDVNDGLKYFNTQFGEARNISDAALARNLYQEVLPFKIYMSAEQSLDLQFTEASLLRLEENFAAALTLYKQLEQTSHLLWFEERHTELLKEKGRCYFSMSNFNEAMATFNKCLDLARAQKDQELAGTVLGWLGFTCRNRGEFGQALKYYEQCRDIYKQLENQGDYANMLNNISFIYKLQGKTKDAVRFCKMGLLIRRTLFQTGKVAEVSVGLSLSTMGQIYLDDGHFVWAEQCFREAFEIYGRIGRKRDLAATYNRFGQIELAQRNFSAAKQWFEKANEASADINMEAFVTSLSLQGDLCVKLGKWDEAALFFEQALEHARTNNEYQYAENLLSLAEVLFHLDQADRAMELLEQANNISLRWNYYDLLGRAQEIQGDMYHRAGEHQRAFVYYRQYCFYVAMRNDVEYNHAVSLVIDRLFDTPKELVQPIVDEFIAYWSTQQLDPNYAALIDTLQDVRQALFLE